MAGTLAETDPAPLGQSPSYSYTANLTLDASGNLSGEAINVRGGFLTQVETVPDGDSPPTDGYQLQLLNDIGVDVLGGGGTLRSATAAQPLFPARIPPMVKGAIYPTITGAGAGAKITLRLTVVGV